MKIPANIYETFCPQCGTRIEYPLFKASFYDFASYLELTTKTIIRVDLEGISYKKINVNDLLREYACQNLTNKTNIEWINLEKELFCSKCKLRFNKADGLDSRFCVEEKVDAAIFSIKLSLLEKPTVIGLNINIEERHVNFS